MSSDNHNKLNQITKIARKKLLINYFCVSVKSNKPLLNFIENEYGFISFHFNIIL